jgi:hypothetical protein
LIDDSAEGLLDKDEFTLRIPRAKERLGRLEEQLQSQADLAAQRREPLLIITRLEDFTSRIKTGSSTPIGTRNEISSVALARRGKLDRTL